MKKALTLLILECSTYTQNSRRPTFHCLFSSLRDAASLTSFFFNIKSTQTFQMQLSFVIYYCLIFKSFNVPHSISRTPSASTATCLFFDLTLNYQQALTFPFDGECFHRFDIAQALHLHCSLSTRINNCVSRDFIIRLLDVYVRMYGNGQC